MSNTYSDPNKTIIKCHNCGKKLRVPINKGTILVKCCENEYKFDPFNYSLLEGLTQGSYYLPDFRDNLSRYNCKMIDVNPAQLGEITAMDIEPLKEISILESKMSCEYLNGWYELHNTPCLIYVFFKDTFEIFMKTISYSINNDNENVATNLMFKLKYIVSTRYGAPSKTIINNAGWEDYYWCLNYGQIFLSQSSGNQVMLQAKYKGYLKYISQYEDWQASETLVDKVTKLNEEANECIGMYDYLKCIEKSKEALKFWPSNGNARLLIGTALLEIGNIKEAEDYLQGAIEFLPDLAHAHFQLGRLYLKTGKKLLTRHYLENYLFLSENTGMNIVDYQYSTAKELLKQID